MGQKRIDRKLDLAVGSVTFTNLENGETATHSVDDVFGSGAWEMLKALKNGEMAQRAMLHSLNAFGGDAAADKTIDAIVAINARVQSVKDGNWTMKGSGGGGPHPTVLAEAIAKVKGLDVDEVAAKLADLDDETKKGLRKNPRVKAAIAEINAKRAKDKAKAAGKEAEGAADDFEL